MPTMPILPTNRVSIVVPLYICHPSLYPIVQRCFDRLDTLDEGDFWIVSVDDASPLKHNFGSRGHFSWNNEENLGYTRTVNRGLKEMFEWGSDIVVVMNDDVLMTRECIDRFKQMRGLQIASPADTASSPDDRFGSCWGITREAYEKLGGLDENYKHFFSDLDYYNRAKAAGVEIIKWNDIILEHPESSTYRTLDKETLFEADQAEWLRRNRE